VTHPAVVDNRSESRFETRTPAGTAVMEYERKDGRLVLTHTEVPETDRKRGLGTRLVAAVLEQARELGLTVVPVCPFVRAYLRKNPQAGGLIEEPR